MVFYGAFPKNYFFKLFIFPTVKKILSGGLTYSVLSATIMTVMGTIHHMQGVTKMENADVVFYREPFTGEWVPVITEGGN